MTYEQVAQIAQSVGFTAWTSMDTSTIDLKTEVRDMCAINSCGQYGKRWSCPPGCGTLEECQKRLQSFTQGILVQTCGNIEDSFDYESILAIERTHNEHFAQMYQQIIQERESAVLALGAGCCTQCNECTYPDEVCRFPDKMVSSMEAYGMLVLEICKANSLQYYYGPTKMAFTSCFLLK